jgi:glutamine synthetase
MVNLLVVGRIVGVAGAGRMVRFVDTENNVHLEVAVTLTMVLAGFKEDIK